MKIDGRYRTSIMRPTALPSVECPKDGCFRGLTFCMSCPACSAGQWKKDGTVNVWCGFNTKEIDK